YTLTLPGIAGIILSLGMAVDANIIISERISEELKKGLTVVEAVKKGYKSAFSSVLDGNVTTAIVAVILMIFGSGSMLSFGYTLLIGMIVNVLVGVSVSKMLLLSFLQYPNLNEAKHFRKKKEIVVFKFFQKKKIYALISGVVFLVGIVCCVTRGVTLDTQFTGGAVISYMAEGKINTDQLEAAIEKGTNRPVTVQVTKNSVEKTQNIVVTLAGNKGLSPENQKMITKAVNSVLSEKAVLAETYAVEPYIGAKALRNSGIAIILSSIFIIIYVWIRFATLHGLAAGLTAMVALVHDVIVVFFTFAIFGIPLNDAFVAVVLTIIGYSINDTIVLYDRIRENREREPGQSVIELVNQSITQTLSRSINTSLTTGLCVLVILAASILFQIGSIREFSLPMFFGLISGCYSSVCIASILWAMIEKKKEKKLELNS
ncbi:MAG: protein translocase subunit SecF, partial [Lachnospiraceae bacterium]